MFKFYTQLEYKGKIFTILKKEYRNYKDYWVFVDDTIKERFSITQMEYEKEDFLLRSLVRFLHKKHFA